MSILRPNNPMDLDLYFPGVGGFRTAINRGIFGSLKALREDLNRILYQALAGALDPQQEGGDTMAKLTIAEKEQPKADGGEQYISRTWLSKTAAPTVDPAAFSGMTAKVFRIVSGNERRHTILYLEDVDPNTKL